MNHIDSSKTRIIVHRFSGNTRGPITRFFSPTDLGEYLKPFVFLEMADYLPINGEYGFGLHPHSGIATLSLMIEGESTYLDTTGKQGILSAGGMEWMRAGNGVWHAGGPVPGQRVRAVQLWIALSADEETGSAHSCYLSPAEIPVDGPVRVLLGNYGTARSTIEEPTLMNYFAVQLSDGEHWRYLPPAGHTVTWVAVSTGKLVANGLIHAGELAVFDESEGAIDFLGSGDTMFVLGSAEKHPHDLITSGNSVHTSFASLATGEATIEGLRLSLLAAQSNYDG